MTACFNKLILPTSAKTTTTFWNRKSYIPDYNAALLVYLGLVVIIDVEFGEKDLVLVG